MFMNRRSHFRAPPFPVGRLIWFSATMSGPVAQGGTWQNQQAATPDAVLHPSGSSVTAEGMVAAAAWGGAKLADAPVLSGLGAFTIAMWVSPVTLARDNMLWSENVSIYSSIGWLRIKENNTLELAIFRRPAETTLEYYARSTATIGAAWTHVACSLGAAGMKVYINGEVAGTNANTLNLVGFTVTSTCIGGMSTSYTPFYGKLDEVMAFNGQLTDAEVLSLANLPFHG